MPKPAQCREITDLALPVQAVGVGQAAGHQSERVQFVDQINRAVVGRLHDRLEQGAAGRGGRRVIEGCGPDRGAGLQREVAALPVIERLRPRGTHGWFK